MIKKRKTRIKEWDYYYLMSNSNKFCLCLTISDLGYLGMYSVSFVDLENAVEHTQSELTAFPLGKTNLPSTSAKGDVGIFAVLQEVADGVGAIFLVYGGELFAVDGFEGLAFIIYRCGGIALLQGYGGKAIGAVLVVSLENQTWQASHLPPIRPSTATPSSKETRSSTAT